MMGKTFISSPMLRDAISTIKSFGLEVKPPDCPKYEKDLRGCFITIKADGTVEAETLNTFYTLDEKEINNLTNALIARREWKERFIDL